MIVSTIQGRRISKWWRNECSGCCFVKCRLVTGARSVGIGRSDVMATKTGLQVLTESFARFDRQLCNFDGPACGADAVAQSGGHRNDRRVRRDL